jgi:hypothetical protein
MMLLHMLCGHFETESTIPADLFQLTSLVYSSETDEAQSQCSYEALGC